MLKKAKDIFYDVFYNDDSKLKTIVFWMFATLPLIIADVFLRYVINPVVMNNFYNVVPVLFNIFWIFLMIYVCRYILPKKAGRIVYACFAVLFGVWFFANYISFKMFSRYLWIESVSLVSEASNYIATVFNYVNIKVVLIFIIYIGSIIIACSLWSKRYIKNKLVRFIPVVISIIGIIGVNTFMNFAIKKDKAIGAWEVWEKPTLIYDKFTDANKSLNVAGLYQYTFKSLYKAIFNTSPITAEEEEQIDSFFESKAENPDNSMTGILKDKNVIFVLMESMDFAFINNKYTPTIKYMMDNGINFNNHYMPHVGMGYTFNAEFAANTGYYCPSNESSASIFTKNSFPFALANMLNNEGYNSTSFHYNVRNFYNRATMHRQFGYKDYKSFMNYLSIEKCVQDSEAAKSDTIYNMMTENEKFLDFIITYSPHLPYDTEDNKLKGALGNYPELLDDSMDLEFRNAYLLAHDTDEFFRVLLERLKEDKLLEDTVIIAFTDHYAYGISDKEKLLDLRKQKDNDILERVPFFIYSPSLKPVKVNKVTSTIDILPTVSNIMGLEKCKYYIGNDAFDENYNGFVYFADGSWYDGKIHYKVGDDYKYSESELEYIKEMNENIAKITAINDYAISTDYFSRIKLKGENYGI